jgi:hypothetical protein
LSSVFDINSGDTITATQESKLKFLKVELDGQKVVKLILYRDMMEPGEYQVSIKVEDQLKASTSY